MAMAVQGASGSFEMFVQMQLEALGELLVAEHHRQLGQQGRQGRTSEVVVPRSRGSNLPAEAATRLPGSGPLGLGSSSRSSTCNGFNVQVRQRKSLFGTATPQHHMQESLQRQLHEHLLQQQLRRENETQEKDKAEKDTSDSEEYSDSSDSEGDLPSVPSTPQAPAVRANMSISRSAVPPALVTPVERKSVAPAPQHPPPGMPIERTSVMPPALVEPSRQEPGPIPSAGSSQPSSPPKRRPTLKQPRNDDVPSSSPGPRATLKNVGFGGTVVAEVDTRGSPSAALSAGSLQSVPSKGEAPSGRPLQSPDEAKDRSDLPLQRTTRVRRNSAPVARSTSQELLDENMLLEKPHKRNSDTADFALAKREVLPWDGDVEGGHAALPAAGPAPSSSHASLLKKLGVIPQSMRSDNRMQQQPRLVMHSGTSDFSSVVPGCCLKKSRMSVVSGTSSMTASVHHDDAMSTITGAFSHRLSRVQEMQDSSPSLAPSSTHLQLQDIGKENVSTFFSPLPVWKAQQCEMSQDLRRGKAFLSAWHQVMPSEEPEELIERKGITWLVNLKVASPNSHRRLIWDLLALCFVAHDAFFIPMEFVGFVDTQPIRILSWSVTIFWSLDMFASLFAGFESTDGSFEGRLGPVARRYAKTWLLPDTVLVAASWTEELITIPGDEERLIYLIQMARMLRLVRLVRIKAALSLVYARLRSERLALLASILQSLSGVIVVVHVIACCWVGLGKINVRQGNSWVTAERLVDHDPWVLYAVAFHWSLTQFYGSMELYPHNLSERIFAIGALLSGFFIATAFVSSVTSSMTRLHIITSQQSSHFIILKKYLQEHRISRRLASRVQLNAKYAMAEQQRNIEEADVEMLQLVSEPLRVELHLEVYGPVLAKHPLFGRLMTCNPAAMRQVCHVAVSTMSVSRDDVLFSRGEVPSSPKMLFLANGALKYTQDGTNFQTLVPGEWAVEAVLWTTWVYHGMLTASEQTRIVMLDAYLFQEIAGKSQTEELALGPYAFEFVKMLNACANVRSDLGTSFDTDSLVSLAYPRSTIQESIDLTKAKTTKKKKKKKNSIRNGLIQPGQLSTPDSFSNLRAIVHPSAVEPVPRATSSETVGKLNQHDASLPAYHGPASPTSTASPSTASPSYRLNSNIHADLADDGVFAPNSTTD